MRRILLVAFIFLSVISQPLLDSPVIGSPLQDSAMQILEQMTPEERIGQLFLIAFRGSAPGQEEEIFTFIKKHHISGVVLRADYDNFTRGPEGLESIHNLILALQSAEYESSLEPSLEDQTSPAPKEPVYIPLFIAISQEGNGAPFSQIYSGMSPLPSQMAIGATWDKDLAKSVGYALGAELQALGINLLLGPSLDVLEDPRLIGTGDLGVRSFGGDPYWVSVLGKAYIEGVHEGSQDKVGVIAKHFPGLGGGDRQPSEEIATIRKSLNLLQQIDLVPFLGVANLPPGSEPAIADGFLTSNVRYQGFQGNIRATTRPLSLDREALDQLMALEGLKSWKEAGGLTMSDSLGSRAIRRFIESLGQSYKGHLIARDAFLAGNDLLYLANIQSAGDPDEATTIRATLAFFAQKYREDIVFAQRVDEAVLRILKFKLRLNHQVFDFQRLITQQDQLQTIGKRQDIAVEVSRRAATLISPIEGEREKSISGPPASNERIVFFSDARPFRQCSTCPIEIDIPIRAMQDAVLRLYGPAAAGQVGDWTLASYSMADLANTFGILPAQNIQIPLAQIEDVQDDLSAADWLVFSVLRSSSNAYGSDALKYLLDTRLDLVIDKKLIVFSHDVPYDLDATEISKIDAYYALYSKAPPFIDYAARLLFQEALAEGASPVSIPGIGYDLIKVTAPDPNQIIQLQIQKAIADATVEGDEQATFTIGDTIRIETGVIIDANGHPVPDGTPVEFVLTYQGENIPSLELSAVTKDGLGKVSTTLDRQGIITIQAESASTHNSDILQIEVAAAAVGGDATPEQPAETATETPEPSNTATPSQMPTEIGQNGQGGVDAPAKAGLDHLVLALLGVGLIVGFAYSIAILQDPIGANRLRMALIAAIGGLAGYNYIAFGFPGSEVLFAQLGLVTGMMMSVIGGGLAILLFWFWKPKAGS